MADFAALAQRNSLMSADPFEDRPAVTFDTTKIYVFETRTGRVLAVVPHVGVPSWSSALNSAGDWKASLWLRDGA